MSDALPGEIITLEEVEAIMLEAGVSAEVVSAMLADPAFVAWVDTMANHAAIAAQLASEGIEESAKAAIWQKSIESIGGQVDDVAVAAARQGSQLVTQMTKGEIKTIAETIAQGMIDGLHPDAIAPRLDMIKGLDSVRARQYLKHLDALAESGYTDAQIERMGETYYNQLLKERRETIAVTESAEAQGESAMQNAKAMEAKTKVWITVGDDRVSDACQANESEGAIPIDQSFGGGVMHEPQHPRCRCATVYQTSPAQTARADESSKRRAADTAAAKETE